MKASSAESARDSRRLPVAAGAPSARRGGPPAAPTLHIKAARGLLARARGLLARPVLAPGCGLLLPGVKVVHGFGMCRAVDLVFLDSHGMVVDCSTLPPWHVAGCAAAAHVIEMRQGEVARLGLRPRMWPVLQPTADIFRLSGASCTPR